MKTFHAGLVALFVSLFVSRSVPAVAKPGPSPASPPAGSVAHDKRSPALRRALTDRRRTRFPVIVRFTHPLTPDEAKQLALDNRWGTAYGSKTRDEITDLVARPDVVAVELGPKERGL